MAVSGAKWERVIPIEPQRHEEHEGRQYMHAQQLTICSACGSLHLRTDEGWRMMRRVTGAEGVRQGKAIKMLRTS